jgi:hypothetical protein
VPGELTGGLTLPALRLAAAAAIGALEAKLLAEAEVQACPILSFPRSAWS